jgi:hypothetical protein
VDLRYDRQIIVNPDLQGTVKQPPLSKSSAKVAMAAGMKPAALITHQVPPPKPTTPVVTSQPQPKFVAKKTAKKGHHKITAKALSKSSTTPGHTQSVAQTNAPSTQAPSAHSTPAPNTSAAPTTAKTNPAPPVTDTVMTKPGSKPSPAIVKGEDHP